MFESFSTCAVDPGEKLHYLQGKIGLMSAGTGMIVRPMVHGFDAQIVRWRLGDVTMFRFDMVPGVMERSGTPVGSSSQRKILVSIHDLGRVSFQIRGRSQALDHGSMLLLSGDEHIRIDASTNHRAFMVELDRVRLSTRRPDIDDYLSSCVPGRDMGARMVHRYLQALWQEAEHDPLSVPRDGYADVLLDLIACGLGAQKSSLISAPFLFRRACQAIEKRLDDPALKPGEVAAELDVSLRTLQAAAAKAGTTLNSYISQRRLQRAAGRLRTEPGTSITMIAHDCGFADSAYFARTFQNYFGAPPSRYRKQS